MYTNYIFDIYGTLIDINSDESKPELWEKLSAFYHFKGALYTPEELKISYEQKIEKVRTTITHTQYPDFPLEPIFNSLYTDKNVIVSREVVEDTAHFFRLLSINYIRLYDGVIEFLKKLKSQNKKLYVLSNAQSIFTHYEMKLLGILDYFDDIFFSADYKTCKPDPQFYNILLDTLKLDKKKSIMIGNDYICDIKGAHDVGLDSLYMHSNLSPEIEGDLLSTYSIMSCNVSQMASLCLKD